MTRHECMNLVGYPCGLRDCDIHPRWVVIRATWADGGWAIFKPAIPYVAFSYRPTWREAFDYALKKATR